jgi:hypothetical protein
MCNYKFKSPRYFTPYIIYINLNFSWTALALYYNIRNGIHHTTRFMWFMVWYGYHFYTSHIVWLMFNSFMCARNYVFNTMYIVSPMVSITPNFCNFLMVFSYQKDNSWKSHYFWREYPYQAITLVYTRNYILFTCLNPLLMAYLFVSSKHWKKFTNSKTNHFTITKTFIMYSLT